MLEIVAGIVIGPSVLGIVHLDEAISVISVIGLAFLLFLAGLEIDFGKLRGQALELTLLGFVISFAIAIAAALLLKATGLIETGCPRLVDRAAGQRFRLPLHVRPRRKPLRRSGYRRPQRQALRR